MSRSVALAGVFVAVAAASFFACVGDDPGIASTGSSDDSGVGSDTQASNNDSGLASDAAPSLGCPLGCLPPAPTGWTGPSAVYDGPSAMKPTACPTSYTQKEVEAFQGLTAAPAACSCGTASYAGQGCFTVVAAYSTAGCPGASGSPLPINEGTITNTAPCLTTLNQGYLKVPAATLSPGTCAFPSPTTTLSDAGATTTDLSCGLPQNAVCTGSAACVATPVPDAPFSRLCIHESGDVACPSADYSKRFVAYTSISDSRSCSACEGTPVGGTCGTTWGVAPNMAACLATPPTTMTVDTCTSNLVGANAVVGANIAPSGVTCASDGGAPRGDVDAGDPITFCCNK